MVEEKEISTVKIEIEFYMDEVRRLWQLLTGTQGQQRIPGELERFGGKPGFYLSLVDGSIRSQANAIQKRLTPDLKWQTDFYAKIQKLQDQFSMRDDRGVAIPGSLDPARVDKYYELLDALEENCKDLIDKETERQQTVTDELREKKITIEIGHKLRIKEPEYREFLFDLKKEELKLLSPFFEGEYDELDFSKVEEKRNREKELEKKIKGLEIDLKVKQDEVDQLKKKAEEKK